MDASIVYSAAAVVILLFLSAIFSGSETALTAASQARMRSLARKGNQRADLVNRLIANKERLIGAILLGNNLVNILASALTTSVLINLAGDAGVIYATILMTVLVLIFAEVLPKTYALKRTDHMALKMAPIMRPIVWLLAPAVQVVQIIVNGTLRLFGGNQDGEDLVDAADELRGAFELHREAGGIVKDDRDMLDSILDLAEVNVDEIMVHRRNMVMIDANDPAMRITAAMIDSPYTRVPLWREDPENIIGVLHAKDLLKAISSAGNDMSALDLPALCRPPWFVPETTTLSEQLSAFRRRREHFALVIDEYGGLMGLVTLEDILEEIVGDIADEHDIDLPINLRQRDDGSFLVEGSISMRDLNRACEWDLPEDLAATVAGLVIHEARKIPEVGEKFQFHGFEFEILRRHRNRITTLLLRRLDTASKDDVIS